MNKIIRIQTKKTPLVKVDDETLLIEGRFIRSEASSHASHFFDPLIAELIRIDISVINFKIEYFSSRASAHILPLCKLLAKKTEKLIINWFHDEDDEDIRVEGEILQGSMPDNVEFNIIENPETE